LKQEKAVLVENALKADADARQWQKEVDVIERRLHVVQKDNDSLGNFQFTE
jgi:hypothetical protein